MALEKLIKRNKEVFFERYLFKLSFDKFKKDGKNKKHKLIYREPPQKSMFSTCYKKNIERLSRPVH